MKECINENSTIAQNQDAYTKIQTAILSGILSLMSDRFAKDSQKLINDLLPWSDEMKALFSNKS